MPDPKMKVNSESDGHVSGEPITKSPDGSEGKAQIKHAGYAQPSND